MIYDNSFSCLNGIITLMIILMIYLIPQNTFSQTDESRNLTENNKQNNVVLSIDPLGFITFGPSLNAEIALGKYIGLQTGFRILNLGLCTHLILNETEDFFPDMKMSWTVNIETKFYIKPKEKLTGFYLGPKFDYGKSIYKDEFDFGGETIWQKEFYDIMVFGLGVGYKWIWENGFSLEPSYKMSFFLSNLSHFKDSEGHSHDYTPTSYDLNLIALYVLSIKVGIAF